MKLVTVSVPPFLTQVPYVGKVVEFKSPRTTISVRLVNLPLEKIVFTRLVTSSPNVNFVKASHPWNAEDYIEVIFPFIVNSSIPLL